MTSVGGMAAGRWQLPYLAAAMLSSLGLLGKADLIRHLVPLPAGLVTTIVILSLGLPVLWPLAIRWRRVIAPMAALGLIGVIFVIFPRVEALHGMGRGSDQADCVIVAARELAQGQWPYRRDLLWTHNPMSCGPGWAALQAPLIAGLDYSWNLVALWGLSLGAMSWALGMERGLAFVALLGICPGVWLLASNGTDFMTFGVVLAAILALTNRMPRMRWPFALLLGLVCQFRPPVVLAPATLSRLLGRLRASAAVALAVGCYAAVFAWNPVGFIADGPFHLAQKLLGPSIVSSMNPAVLLLATLLATALLAGILLALDARLARHTSVSTEAGLLAFLAMVFVPPAALDLVVKLRERPDVFSALSFWEGGTWVVACLPVAALILVTSTLKPASR